MKLTTPLKLVSAWGGFQLSEVSPEVCGEGECGLFPDEWERELFFLYHFSSKIAKIFSARAFSAREANPTLPGHRSFGMHSAKTSGVGWWEGGGTK